MTTSQLSHNPISIRKSRIFPLVYASKRLLHEFMSANVTTTCYYHPMVAQSMNHKEDCKYILFYWKTAERKYLRLKRRRSKTYSHSVFSWEGTENSMTCPFCVKVDLICLTWSWFLLDTVQCREFKKQDQSLLIPYCIASTGRPWLTGRFRL